MKTQFGIRECKEEWRQAPYWEIIAVTPRQNCYRLGHAECDENDDGPAIGKTEDFTLDYAKRLWKEDRRAWLPDSRGAGGVKVWLN